MILIFIKKVLQFATKYGKIQTFGALAQLGERYTGSVEVSGSIPLCSTTPSASVRRRVLEVLIFFALFSLAFKDYIKQ